MTSLSNPSIDSLITIKPLDKLVQEYSFTIELQDLFNICRYYSNQGCDMATVNVGIIYEECKLYTRAVISYAKAAHNGNTDAMIRLGNMYRDGKGVKKNYQMAYIQYHKSIANGDNLNGKKTSINCEAADKIATLYYTGSEIATNVTTDFPKNEKNALYWYSLAANAGNVESMMMMVHMYTNGIGCEKDLHKAMLWHIKSGYVIDYSILAKYYKIYPTKDIMEQLVNHYMNGGITKKYIHDVIKDAIGL
jgi:hypothetical protein